jgi:hypothetical protein
MMHYCYIEAVNLDNLFRDCQDLSTIRGGGLMALNVAEDVQRALGVPDKDLLTKGASQGLLRVEGSGEDSIRTKVEDLLPKLTPGPYATVMAAVRPEDPAKFRELLASMKAEIRWRQMQSPSVVYPACDGQGVCQVDLVRPAKRRPGKPEWQSDFTYSRRQFGRTKKHELVAELLRDLTPEFEVVNHISDLAGAPAGYDGNLKDKIAVLRFDGNSFGGIVSSCEKPEDFQEFSTKVRENQEAYFRRLLDPRREFGGEHWWEGGKLRCEILVYGGDEVTLVVPAWLGWDALACFYDSANPFPEFQGKQLTYSGGIVFAHSKAPIHTLRDLASGLADEAKRRAPRDEKSNIVKGNFTACQVLESFDNIGSDIGDFLDKLYRFTSGKGILMDADFIHSLRTQMVWWRLAVSRRQLHGLVRRMQSGEAPVEAEFRKLAENPDASNPPQNDLWEHHKRNPAFLLHLLELWDYVAPELLPEVGA